MSRSSPSSQAVHLVLLGGLVLFGACNPSGLQPVDDTSDPTDTDDTPQITLLGILVTPERAVIPLGGELQLIATGLREDRTSLDVTAVATWGSDRPSVAQVSENLDEEGVLAGLTVGEAKVYAEVNGVRSVPVTVKVTDSAVLGLTVTPAQVTVGQGSSARLVAEATYTDGTRADATQQVIWVTDDGQVATMESGGKLNGVALGTTVVSAEWGEITSKDVPVTVIEGASVDLRILSARGEGGPDDIMLTVKVQNDGAAGVSDFWVDVFVDPPSPPSVGQFGDYYAPVAYLDAGQSKEIAFHFDATPGNRTLWVMVDADGSIEESDETNNALSASVTVGESAGTNLSIPYFDYYADEDYILYVVDVYNSSTQAVGPFWVDLWVHSEDDPTIGMGTIGGPACVGDEFEEVDTLGPGATTFVDFMIDVIDLDPALDGCAYCWSWVMVDTCGAITELYEDDNTAGPIEVEVPSR